MLVKTAELIGPSLDWAVLVADKYSRSSLDYWLEKWADEHRRNLCESPSTDWAQGGPIIERENIHPRRTYNCGVPNTGADAFRAEIDFIGGSLTLGEYSSYGSTPLTAAMRCYVASKLGDEVEIPEELLT